MTPARLVTAAPEHVAAVARCARPADAQELWAQARATPAECMTLGLRESTVAYTGLLDEVPVCMFGVTPHAPGEGVPWMVGTTALESRRAQRELLRISRDSVAEFQALYPLLFNYVDERNAAAQRWLRWLGFTLDVAYPLGHDGELFRYFYRESR
jgi:hypothetical protein